MEISYKSYKQIASKAADLSAAISLLNWDQEVHMPEGAAHRRAKQLSTLASIHHQTIVDELVPLVNQLINSDSLNEIEQLNLSQHKVELDKEVKLPIEFVSKITQKISESQFVWEKARKNNNWNDFSKTLSELIDLKKEEADYYGYEGSPYNALLDTYEPGATIQFIDSIFIPLKEKLIPIIEQINNSNPPEDQFLYQDVNKDAQWNYSMDILKKLGFDFHHGRQDISTHPFTTDFGMEDVRITTRINPKDICNVLYSTIHEFGHATYEQGLNPDYYGTPLAQACSLSIHESQSRIWENNIGRSAPFCHFIFESFRSLFPDQLNGRSANDLFLALNVVRPNFIRTSSDEVTYHLHIILRYELEKDLIEGNLSVKDLPDAWNEKIENYLGLEVDNLLNGVLQDIHWSMGAFGYFPTYSIGSMYASQFYTALKGEYPNLESNIQAGKFEEIKDWLNSNVFTRGRLYNSDDLCIKITGKSLSIDDFIAYLKNKLSSVYDINFT